MNDLFEIFPNAPITEAILDIRVSLPPDVDIASLEKIYESIKNQFPEKVKKHSVQAELSFPQAELAKESPMTFPATGAPVGFLFRSSSEQKIFQARLDGFTFNKLQPYSKWEAFRDEANKLWNLYSEVVGPIAVSRIALRFINKIEIPFPIKDFKDYILTIPEIAPGLPDTVSNFFMQLAITDHNIQANAIITETIGKTTSDRTLPFIFDIDVFFEKNYEVGDGSMWEDFETLHTYKNRLFFNSITPKTKELFK